MGDCTDVLAHSCAHQLICPQASDSEASGRVPGGRRTGVNVPPVSPSTPHTQRDSNASDYSGGPGFSPNRIDESMSPPPVRQCHADVVYWSWVSLTCLFLCVVTNSQRAGKSIVPPMSTQQPERAARRFVSTRPRLPCGLTLRTARTEVA
jgi:hypothetical protein